LDESFYDRSLNRDIDRGTAGSGLIGFGDNLGSSDRALNDLCIGGIIL
jgi:hypothetical protein